MSTFNGSSPSPNTTLLGKQATARNRHQSDAATDLITLEATSSSDTGSITYSLHSPDISSTKEAPRKVASLHPAKGGISSDIPELLCGGKILLEALVVCASVSLKLVATELSIPLLSRTVTAEGDLDFRDTLVAQSEISAGFKAIRLKVHLEIAQGEVVQDSKLEKLGKLTGRHCLVLQTIAEKPSLMIRLDQHTKSVDGIKKSVTWTQKV